VLGSSPKKEKWGVAVGRRPTGGGARGGSSGEKKKKQKQGIGSKEREIDPANSPPLTPTRKKMGGKILKQNRTPKR